MLSSLGVSIFKYNFFVYVLWFPGLLTRLLRGLLLVFYGIRDFLGDTVHTIFHEQEMKMLTMRLAVPLLGVFLWVLSIHAGTFVTALLPSPKTGYGSNYIVKGSYPTLAEMGIKVTEKDLNDSVNFAHSVVDNMKRLETNLGWSDITVRPGSPSHGMFISFGPEKEAVNRGKDAFVAMRASVQLLNSFCHRYTFNRKDCAKHLTNFKFHKTPLKSSCAHLEKRCTPEEYFTPYRSIDGSCNHAYRASKGESFTAYDRLLTPDYLDGVNEPRRAVNKRSLPSPRLVSTSLVEYTQKFDDHLTLAVMQWGQFVEHDLSRPATAIMFHTEKPIECCGKSGNNLSPRYIHPFCSPVAIPLDDKHYSAQGVDCMTYVRSVPALRPDCTFGPTEQINQATHYLDGSQIYGTSHNKSKSLRSFVGGKLKVSSFSGKQYLPLSENPTDDCQVSSSSSPCFKSGDSRVNFQPQLTTMHTIWYREHNRVADALAAVNDNWDDETLFQEARRIVIAELQHITYNEWLVKVLAKKYVNKILKFSEYDSNENPSVSNSFATAAIRTLKSLHDGKVKLFKEDRAENASVRLERYFNNPEIIQETNAFDALVRSLATQSSQKVDMHYAEDLINNLYTNGAFGYDVLSMDIQRGRDHGLPAYVHYRSLCGLPDAIEFNDFVDVMPERHIEALAKVYSSPKDVDLIIGGLMEMPEDDSLFGPTFSCIIGDQFRRTKKGDRYFYSHENQPKPFATSQLNEIGKVTLARIFCDNANNVVKMQPNVFEKIQLSNNLVRCDGDDIPRISFAPWKESRERYH